MQLEAPCEVGVVFVTADALIVLVAQVSLPSVSHLKSSFGRFCHGGVRRSLKTIGGDLGDKPVLSDIV